MPFPCVGRISNFASHHFLEPQFLVIAQVQYRDQPLLYCSGAITMVGKVQRRHQPVNIEVAMASQRNVFLSYFETECTRMEELSRAQQDATKYNLEMIKRKSL